MNGCKHIVRLMVLATPLWVAACGGGENLNATDVAATNDVADTNDVAAANLDQSASASTVIPDTGDSTDTVASSNVLMVDVNSPPEYVNQSVPAFINRDNTDNNPITNPTALLGRVLFYDKNLSVDQSVSCASCHQQENAFSDIATVSTGVNGVTGRHSMRLINSRFAEEGRFFWDERAATLEQQTTQPIRDHGEMGFSGENGSPDFDDLLLRMQGLAWYEQLFINAYGNSVITEERMQLAMAQFIRSIQSFDSKFDIGRAQVGSDNQDFSNFTAEENAGKRLFMQRPAFTADGRRVPGTGLGCNACHRAPEFDIDPRSDNNGVIGVAGSVLETDTTNTRSPSLRDLFNVSGVANGPFMHDGSLATFDDVLDHYNRVENDRNLNNNLDNRLSGGGRGGNNANNGNGLGQQLELTAAERAAVTAFMKTLTGAAVYTDTRWSNPFAQ